MYEEEMSNVSNLYSNFKGSNEFTVPKKVHLNEVKQGLRSYPKPTGPVIYQRPVSGP